MSPCWHFIGLRAGHYQQVRRWKCCNCGQIFDQLKDAERVKEEQAKHGRYLPEKHKNFDFVVPLPETCGCAAKKSE